MQELWKDVQGYEGLYQVSNYGRVRSLDHGMTVKRGESEFVTTRKGRIISPTRRQHGYLGVMLYGRGGHKKRGFKTFAVHRLVAEAFVENPNGYTEVNHKDECKQNNRADNLEWCDRTYNVNYGTAQERRAKATLNLPSKSKRVTQKTLSGIEITEWPSMAEIERQTGFYKSAICLCCQHKQPHAYGYRWEYA